MASSPTESVSFLLSAPRAKKPANAATIAEIINNRFGIPGTNPISNKTADTGIQAFEILNCSPICSAISCLSDTRVTIIAVEIASNSDGI